MKFFYFLVNWEQKKCPSNALHNYFFIEHNAFIYGLLLAIITALVFALIYYFVLGKKVTTAKMGNWWICGIAALVITFGVSNYIIIGLQPSDEEYAKSEKLENKLTYKYSFYKSLDYAVSFPKKGKGKTLINNKTRESEKKKLIEKKADIQKHLNQGKDVRYPFSLNTTLWCAILFFAFSMAFKGMSQAAKTKPIKWPY